MPDLSKWPQKLEPYLLPLIVVLVGLTAFGLGRLSTVAQAEVAGYTAAADSTGQ